MKSIKTLLKITLKQGNEFFVKGDGHYYPLGFYGLCGFTEILLRQKIITLNEHIMLNDFIHKHKPKDAIFPASYFWTPKLWPPRKQWLEDHVKNM